ncbi:hypothetical protein KL935_004344 [Ogataea polymorpha]|nr:hypothetical protein KL935_004344 [Ogataea polymorpha]KAG7930944.1 hypothetical protein KL934_004570 [Ogataea polymorpha]
MKDIKNALCKQLLTKEGLIGDYNYKHLFTPKVPHLRFWKKRPPQDDAVNQPFFAVDQPMPILLGMILGFQHALAMLGGVMAPPLSIASSANLSDADQQYLVSCGLIVSGILTAVQVARARIWKTNYYIGSGLISVVGISFTTVTITSNAFPMMYNSGFCPVDASGAELPCPDGYGAIIATGSVCALSEIAISFLPPKVIKKLFPPIITGSVVVVIGLSLVKSGFKDWLGGSGCMSSDYCPSASAPHPLPWGSAEFIGLGFLVYVSIIAFEKWGAPIMKSCSVILGLLVGCIVAAACNYFDNSSISSAPVANFLWVKTFKLKVYGPAVLPMLAMYSTSALQAIGDITATCDVSRVEVEGPQFQSRIQGCLLADGLSGVLSGLFTLTPVGTFAQNNGVISITKCANRKVGYWCCFYLIVMGVFSKFAAALVAIPKAVLGGMTTFLFGSVFASGLSIIGLCKFTRRDRFILTGALVPGCAAVLIPTWFDNVFTYSGSNDALTGFLQAIIMVMETGYALTAVLGVILNLIIPWAEDDFEAYGISENVELENVSNVNVVMGPKELESQGL